MQVPTIIASIIAAVLLILLLYLYFGQLGPLNDELDRLREEQTAMQNEIAQLENQKAQLEQQLSVEMVERIHFESGSAYISEEFKQQLDTILPRLQGAQNQLVRVVGHTDDRMIVPDFPRIYASNWELSVHRATHVVRFLEEAGIEPERIQAAGMSKYHSIASNETPEGKAQNRRVEIYLVPER